MAIEEKGRFISIQEFNNQEMAFDSIKEIAIEIFNKCQIKTDCCVQKMDIQSIVFGNMSSRIVGGINRLIFSPKTGWKIDEFYCTSQFIVNWNKIKDNYCHV